MIEVTHNGATIRIQDPPGGVQVNGVPYNLGRVGGTELLRWMELREWPAIKRIAVLEAVRKPERKR